MIFDKPVINPVFGNKENGLYDDQRFLKYAHYEKVVASNSVSIAKNVTELVKTINEGLDKPEAQQRERGLMLNMQVGMPLKETGKRIVKELST